MTDSNNPLQRNRIDAHFAGEGRSLWMNYFVIDISSNINILEKQIAELCNEYGVSRHELAQRAFVAGLAELERDWKHPLFEIHQMPRVARAMKLAELREARQVRLQYQEMLELMDNDIETFSTWAKETNQPGYEEFLKYREDHKLIISDYKEWLRIYLSDGESHHIDDIKRDIFEANIITTKGDWNTVATYASRQGYPDKENRGYWKNR